MGAELSVRKNKKVRSACRSCRRRKSKCDGYHPCSTCLSRSRECNYEGVVVPTRKPQHYAAKERMLKELDKATDAFSILERFSSLGNNAMKADLSKLNESIEKYRQQLLLIPDMESFKHYRGADSIEKILVDQEHITLGKLTNVSLLSHDKVYDVYYGLYSSNSLESFAWFSWVIKMLNIKEIEAKLTIYIFLKYLDLATAYYSDCLCWMNSPSRLLVLEFPNLSNLTIHEKVRYVIQEHFGGSFDRICDIDFPTSDQPGKLLQVVGEAASILHESLGSNLSNSSDHKFTYSEDKLLMACGSACVMSCLFSGVHDSTVIDGIFTFLESMHWQMEQHSIGRLVTLAVRFCLDLGIHRWEFYLDMKEAEADKYRVMWWTCLWWDRWYALITGKPFLITEEFAMCLFPRCLSDMGIRDTMEPEEMLNFVRSMRDDAAILLFSRVFLSKIISKVFKDIAFNRKFTDIIFLSSDFQEVEPLLEKLIQKQYLIGALLERYETELSAISRENECTYIICSTRLSYAYVKVLCLSVTENLILRYIGKAELNIKNEMNTRLSTMRSHSAAMSEKILCHFLRASETCRLYLFAGPVNTCLTNVACNFLEQPMKSPSFTLSILCKIAREFHDLQTSEAKARETSNSSNQFFDIICYRTYLMVRVSIQVYLGRSGVSKESLITDMSEIDLVASDMCSIILDNHLELFGQLFNSNRPSPLHKALVENFGQKLGSTFFESVHENINAEEDQGSPIDRNAQGEEFFSADELGKFLKLDFSLEDFADLWTLNKFWIE